MSEYEIIAKDGDFFLAKDENGFFVGRSHKDFYVTIFRFK